MLPAIKGMIDRRVLLNFRADPAVARRLVPEPLEVVTRNGVAVVGVCLIRLEGLRPRGVPTTFGVRSENMAHRIAIRYPTDYGMRDGVFIWQRYSDQRLFTLLGGRLFPGVHRHAEFQVREHGDVISIVVRTEDHEADVACEVIEGRPWVNTETFGAIADFRAPSMRGALRGCDCRRLSGK